MDLLKQQIEALIFCSEQSISLEEISASLKISFDWDPSDEELLNSIEELKQGKNYSILEFNGSGAEPNHIYDAGISIWQAYREILKHWKALYRISKYNHKHGTPYWSYRKGRKFLNEAFRHFRMLEKFD